MSIAFGSSYTVRQHSWSSWKAIQAEKALLTQYHDDGVLYTIYGYDGPEVHVCTIWKGGVPDGVISGGLSQAQNDNDKSDFEANYETSANRPVERFGVCENVMYTNWTENQSLGSSFQTVWDSSVSGYKGCVLYEIAWKVNSKDIVVKISVGNVVVLDVNLNILASGLTLSTASLRFSIVEYANNKWHIQPPKSWLAMPGDIIKVEMKSASGNNKTLDSGMSVWGSL